MQQQTQKKEWKTPELLVLVRSKPEEAVLMTCKQAAISGSSSSNDNLCTQSFPIACATCDSRAGS
jgi:hypothetical protein